MSYTAEIRTLLPEVSWRILLIEEWPARDALPIVSAEDDE